MLIKDILRKGIKTISPNATMVDADEMFKAYHIRHLPVSQGKEIVGMLSDKDMNRAMIIFRNEIHIDKQKKVSQYMSSPVFKMNHKEKVSKLIREMLDKKISSVVILDDDFNAIGIITSQDLMLVLMDILVKKESFTSKILKIFRPR